MAQGWQGSIQDYVSRPIQAAEDGQGQTPESLHETLPQPSPGDVSAAVNRIRDSHTLKGCNKLIHLLEFLVETTLGGEADYLKETTIGVFVFGRSPDYDPKLDTIVRSQAWRLRTKLDRYYAGEGRQDPLIIDLPRGHYIPTFTFRNSQNSELEEIE